VKRHVARRVKWREQQQKYSLLDYETLQKTKIFGERTAAARNDVMAKKIASGRPEDWTVSGPCHLYCEHKVKVLAPR